MTTLPFEFIASILAVVGVVLNNRLSRICFPIWVVSNSICLILHFYAGLYGLAVRDIIFTALAIEGWFLWREKCSTKIVKRQVKKGVK